MSQKLRKEIASDPEYSRCALQGIHPEIIGQCAGRITREHAVINAAKKIQKKWAIIPCCAKHHGVDQYQDAHTEAPKDMREWVALTRATWEELTEYPKSKYFDRLAILNNKYGRYTAPEIKKSLIGINY